MLVKQEGKSLSRKTVGAPVTEPVITFENVSKSYAIYDAPSDRLKELITLNRVKKHRKSHSSSTRFQTK